MRRPYRLNWCASCGGGRNFGDQLGPILLRHFGIPFAWSRPVTSDLVTVGSILSKVPNGWRGTVLGTGFIRPGIRRNLGNARVLSVRGVLTRKACNLPVGTPLGDLGILVGDLPRIASPAVPELVIPHYVDHAIIDRHRGAASIPITSEPAALLGAIASAGLVRTSSLHALIAADALGVPSVLELHPDVHGGLFKFTDYASAFGVPIAPGIPYLSPRAAMADRQRQARELVSQL